MSNLQRDAERKGLNAALETLKIVDPGTGGKAGPEMDHKNNGNKQLGDKQRGKK